MKFTRYFFLFLSIVLFSFFVLYTFEDSLKFLQFAFECQNADGNTITVVLFQVSLNEQKTQKNSKEDCNN